MLLASTSSAYGANRDIPFKETDRADHQISFYAATKKSAENMAHSYSHLYNLPITMFRFFTVYGPLGRPDMALFKFTKAILNGDPIDVYNNGNMSRDFTYIDDLITGLRSLLDVIPAVESERSVEKFLNENISEVAPFRVINIGNAKPEKLMEFIKIIRKSDWEKGTKKFLPMQAGDVEITWADTGLLESIVGHKQSTEITIGVERFVNWYREYYQI